MSMETRMRRKNGRAGGGREGQEPSTSWERGRKELDKESEGEEGDNDGGQEGYGMVEDEVPRGKKDRQARVGLDKTSRVEGGDVSGTTRVLGTGMGRAVVCQTHKHVRILHRKFPPCLMTFRCRVLFISQGSNSTGCRRQRTRLPLLAFSSGVRPDGPLVFDRIQQ